VLHLKVGFIGAGNMAASIIGGLLEQGLPVENIRASDPSQDALERLKNIAPLSISQDNRHAVEGADVVVLAVKPQVMAAAAASIRDPLAASGAMALSIAAGITLESLERGLGSGTPIVRCMPNTPALLREGAAALYANDACGPAQREIAEAVLAAVGTVCWVQEEQQLDAVTALSGSGPAYFFLLLEAMTAAGVKLGLDPVTCRQLAVQTALGSARMAADDEISLQELRRRVTSPGGTTERALQSLQAAGFTEIMEAAIAAAAERSRELAREME
jgi:pyrroline-5-carboxylate reductase